MNTSSAEGVVLIEAFDGPHSASTVSSFASWIAPHLQVMTAVAIREVGRNDAEDLVQDTATRAWQRRSTYRPERGTARVWLLTLLMDQARRRRTRNARHLVVTPTSDPPEPVIPDEGERRDRRLDVETAVAGLPRRQREVVTLFYLAGLPVEHVSAVLGVSAGTVKSHLSDARTALRIVLERP